MKKAHIFMVLLLIPSLIIIPLWFILSRRNIKESLTNFRCRRSNDEITNDSSFWIQRMMNEQKNKSRRRDEENILASTLASQLITSPEDIMMKYITQDNFGCKDIKHALKIFGRNYNGPLTADLAMYVRLFSSLRKFYRLLCERDEKYRKIFAPYQDEILSLHEQFVDCQGALDWYEKNGTAACTEAHKILKCHHEALLIDIGSQIANDYTYVFEQVINAALKKPCKFKSVQTFYDDILRNSGVVKQSNQNLFLIITMSIMRSFY